MDRRADRAGSGSRYFIRFGVTALLLIAGTLVLVLFVLPQRYVLSSGFRESGMSFPTPRTPFTPFPVVQVAARPLPTPPPEIPPGPAELFWAEVSPILANEQYADAIPVFERYLLEHPEDTDVRREYAITLLAADRPATAVPQLRRLLASREDPGQRLLLARTLRELGRTDEASAEYSALARSRPDDMGLALEWAQAHAWAEEYDDAAAILTSALSRDPTSVPLRVELARVYFSLGRLEDAAAILADIDDTSLADADALTLRADVAAALFVPDEEEVVVPPPTLLEQAVAARVAGNFQGSVGLFQEALRESPEDPEIWQAYADLLEYELGNFEGAHAALLEVKRLSEPSADRQYRLALLEVWTGRNADARARLLALLDFIQAPRAASEPVATGSEGPSPVTPADVQALLGDLRRWEGDRIGAAKRYRLALETDPANPRALDGMEALRAEVAGMMVELEQPRFGGSAYSLGDTDDYTRVDLAGEWVELGSEWVWGGSAGNRWLGGLDLGGATANRQGVYVDLEAGRWWRWGTLRSGLSFGAERVRDSWDYSFGGSLLHRRGPGSTVALQYEHAPAYPLTSTLQSVVADLVQDRLTLGAQQPLGARWGAAAELDAAWLRANRDSIAGGVAEGSGRVQAALSLGRLLSPTLTIGLSTRVLGFTHAAPETPTPGGGLRPLFWDPRVAVSAGPYAEFNRDLSRYWKATGRIGPGLALIDERRSNGYDLVPHLSAEAGVRREGRRYWIALDLFYYQGQFNGYRMYGARLSLSARDLSMLGGSR